MTMRGASLALVVLLAACSGDAPVERTGMPGQGATCASPGCTPAAPASAAGASAGPAGAPAVGAFPPNPPVIVPAPAAGAPAAVGGRPSPAPALTPMAPPPPEMTGVIFDWPETEPGSAPAKPCKAGRYVGEYKCRLYIVATEGDGAFDVSGTVDMQLEQVNQGELLRVANGKFSSATLAAIPMTADIIGELACSKSRFEGRLENGKFSVALGLPIPFTEGTFSGDLSSDYDHEQAALHGGTWEMMGELDLIPGSCMDGSWSARWVE